MKRKYGPVYDYRHDPVYLPESVEKLMLQTVESKIAGFSVMDFVDVVLEAGKLAQRDFDWRCPVMQARALRALQAAGLVTQDGRWHHRAEGAV